MIRMPVHVSVLILINEIKIMKLTSLLSNTIFKEIKPKNDKINEFTGKIKPGLINFTMSQITSRK